MASATVDTPSVHRLHAEALPVVDLRLLSIQELYALSLTSISSVDLACCDDVVIPKIDRSVFNESAGSRKQTYSRLRLGPRKPELPQASSRRKSIGTPASRSCPDTIDHENRKIINCLLELFDPDRRNSDPLSVEVEYAASAPEITSVRDSALEIPLDVIRDGRKRKRDRKPKKQKLVQGHVMNSDGHDGYEITVAKEALELDSQIEIELGGSASETTGVPVSVPKNPIDVVDIPGKRKISIKPKNHKRVQGPVVDNGGHASDEVTAFMVTSDMNRKNEMEYAGSPELSCVRDVPIVVFDSGAKKERARKLKNQNPLGGILIDSGGHVSDEITELREPSYIDRKIGIEYGELASEFTFSGESVLEIPIGVVDSVKNIKKRVRKPKNQKLVFDSGGHGNNETTNFKNTSDVDRQIVEYCELVPKMTVANERVSEIPIEMPEMTIAHESVCDIPIEVIDSGEKKRRGRKPRSQKPVDDSGGLPRKEIFRKFSDMDRQIINRNGIAVDVVALANATDPYGPELKKRSEGLMAKIDLLEFLEKINGEWASTRKKRKIVDASDFGDILPIGWKLLLLLKRRENRASIICSRYISPSGHQFASCKEASSYMCSLLGLQDARQAHFGYDDRSIPSKCEMTFENTAELTIEDERRKEGQGCYFPSFNPSVIQDAQAEKILNCSEYYMISNEKDDLLISPSSPNSAELKGRIGPYFSNNILPNDEVYRERNYNDGVHAASMQPNPLRGPTVQSSLDLNRDSVTKPFDSKVESKLNSISDQSRVNMGTGVDSCTNEYNCDDVEELKDYNNSCSLSENSYNNQNRGHSLFDSTHSKVSESMNIDVVDLNLFLGKDDFQCSQVDNIYDEHQIDEGAPHVGEQTSVAASPRLGDDFMPEIVSGNCLQSQQSEGKTFRSEHIEYDCQMKDTAIDFGENFGNSARKKLLISRKRAIPQSEHKTGFPGSLKWGLTCGITEPKQENGSKAAISTPYVGEHMTTAGHTMHSRSSTPVQPCNEKSFIVEDNENIVSTSNFSFPHQEKASESGSENHANNISGGTTEELKLHEDSKSDSELVFDFGSICSRQEDEDNLDTDDSKMCWNTETGQYADGLTNDGLKISFGVSSPNLSAGEHMFSGKNNGNGLHTSTLEEHGQKTDIESSLLSLSCTSDVQKKFHVAGIWDEERIDKANNHQNARPVVSSDCSYFQSDMWKTDDQSGVVKRHDLSFFQPQNTVYPQVHSPRYFPSFGLMSNKDESDLFSEENQKYESANTLEPMEFDFLTAQTDSFPQEPKAVPYGGVDAPFWHQVSTLCVWCRNEFCETVDSRANTDSMGLMCPSCKARF